MSGACSTGCMTGKAYRCTAHTYSAWGPAGPGQAGKLEHWERRGAREVERRHHAHGAHRELAHDRREALVALGVVHGRPLACAATPRDVRFLLVTWYLLGAHAVSAFLLTHLFTHNGSRCNASLAGEQGSPTVHRSLEGAPGAPHHTCVCTPPPRSGTCRSAALPRRESPGARGALSAKPRAPFRQAGSAEPARCQSWGET